MSTYNLLTISDSGLTAGATYWLVVADDTGYTLLGSATSLPSAAGGNAGELTFQYVQTIGSAYQAGNSETFTNLAAVSGDTSAGQVFLVDQSGNTQTGLGIVPSPFNSNGNT